MGNVLNRPNGFEIYLVNVKTMRTIVAFSEKLNFTYMKGREIEIGDRPSPEDFSIHRPVSP